MLFEIVDTDMLVQIGFILAFTITCFNCAIVFASVYHMFGEKNHAALRDCMKDVVSALTWELTLIVGLYVYIESVDFISGLLSSMQSGG